MASKRKIKKGRVFATLAITMVLATTAFVSLKENANNSQNNDVTAKVTEETQMTTTTVTTTEMVKTEKEAKQTRYAEDLEAYKHYQTVTQSNYYILKVKTNSVNLYDSYGNVSAYPQEGDYLLTDGIVFQNFIRVVWRNNNAQFVTGWVDFYRDSEEPLTETKGYYEIVQ